MTKLTRSLSCWPAGASCTSAKGGDRVDAIRAIDMEPLKLYNVKRSAWHTHTLSEDATVLIVENCDTVAANSPQVRLEPAQRAK